MRLLAALCALLDVASSLRSTAELIGSWRLQTSTSPIVAHKRASLEIMPDLDREQATRCKHCNIKFSIRETCPFSTSITHYVEGCTVQTGKRHMQLQWRSKKRSEVVLCGIGMMLTNVDFVTPRPKGTQRDIRWQIYSSNVLQVTYEKHVFIFSRVANAESDESGTLLPIEMWLAMQCLGWWFAHFIQSARL
jgi:hypothetical protein